MSELNQPLEEALFELAAQKPAGAERAAFLDGVCRDQPALRARLDLLLEGFDGGPGFLRQTPERPKPAAVAVAPEEPVTQQIGRYRLLEKLGEGGFGEVWMAEQREPVKRRVALKLIKLGMDSRQIVARFEAERQALALMDHPNIAKIFDAGTTESPHPASGHPLPSDGRGAGGEGSPYVSAGRPYFVMELVRGLKITEYCDQCQLPTAGRLKLFIKVCQAVQHAHQKGIIHRDIKPSNILVTVNDGVPVPKVIDFGIAKATQGELTDKTVFTQFQQFIGTPAYISPEQAEMSSLDIDTRADIYSLGVLLYELLVGQTPFDAREMMKGGIDALRQIIREREPQRPSTKLSTLAGEERTTAGKRRQTDVAKLAHQLQGDLDWIVLKCLEKDRNRRYETANGLAADLQRHLANEPVVARPPSTAYRMQKAWQRNKLVFSATAAIALVLLVGTTVSSWLAVRATQAQRAAEQSQAAEREQKRLAQEKQQEAETQRQRAELSEANTADLLYAANLNLVQANFEQSNIPMVRTLLEQTRSHTDRGFEWYYWQRQLHRETRIFREHGGYVQRVAFTPDGKSLITSGEDGVILIRDVATGVLQRRMDDAHLVSVSADGERLLCRPFVGSGLEIFSATTGAKLLGPLLGIHPTFSPDGTKFAARWGERVVVRDSVTGVESLSFKAFSPFAGFLDHLRSISFSPDGRWILVAEASLAGGVAAYDALTGDRKQVFAVADDHMQGTFSPDGQRIAIWPGVIGTPSVWERDRPSQPANRLLGTATIAMRFSPDGRRLLGGGSENRVLVWDAATFQLLGQFQGHTAAIQDIAYSSDGRWVATASQDGTARIWPADAFADAGLLQDPRQPVRCDYSAFSPDGRYLATAGGFSGLAVIWDAATGKALHRLRVNRPAPIEGQPAQNSTVESVSFSPDSRRLVASGDNFVAAVFDVESGRLQLTLDHSSTNQADRRITSAVFSPNGKQIVTMNNLKVKTWDTESGRLLRTKAYTKTNGLHTMPPVGFTPDGRLYCASIEEVTIWDAVTDEEVFQLPVEDAKMHSAFHPIIAFSPDGKHFALACLKWKGDIQIRGTASGQLLGKLEGHREQVFSLEFSPDGNRLLSGGRDRMVKIWDWRSGRELLSLKAPNVISCARFAPDGRKIVAGGWFDHGLLWEAATLEQVADWEAEQAAGATQWQTLTEEFQKRRKVEGGAADEASRPWRAAMMQRTAEKLALLGDLSRFTKDPGAIRQWLVLSPPPGFFGGPIQLDEEQLPDEARLRPRAHELTRPDNQDRVWVPLHLEDYRLDFRKNLKGTHTPMVAYAVSYVLSDRDQSGLVLKVGSDYHAKLYLNQREIHRSVDPATVEPDRDTVTGVELKAGLNVLVFKVVRADRDADLPWGGSVRFTTTDGSPVTGLTVTLDPDAKQ